MKGKKRVIHDYLRCTVIWADHWAKDLADYDPHEVTEMARRPIYYEFTGYLIEETDECIAVGSHIRSDGMIANPMSIMMDVIIEWEVWHV